MSRPAIHNKILTSVYRSLHGHATDYLKDLLSRYNPTRVLRSKSCNNLEVLRARGAYGTSAFSICGPRLWNKLPRPLKNATTPDTLKHIFFNTFITNILETDIYIT